LSSFNKTLAQFILLQLPPMLLFRQRQSMDMVWGRVHTGERVSARTRRGMKTPRRVCMLFSRTASCELTDAFVEITFGTGVLVRLAYVVGMGCPAPLPGPELPHVRPPPPQTAFAAVQLAEDLCRELHAFYGFCFHFDEKHSGLAGDALLDMGAAFVLETRAVDYSKCTETGHAVLDRGRRQM